MVKLLELVQFSAESLVVLEFIIASDSQAYSYF